MNPILQKLSAALARVREKLPARDVGLAPADAFFTRKVELPADLAWADRVAFIELFLESNAPFPMDQLAWGFLDAAAAPFAFVFATPKSRLKRLGFEHPERQFQLFPAFISLYGDAVGAPTVRFIVWGGTLSALFLSGAHPVPEKVVSRKIEAALLTDDVLLAARERMAASPEAAGWRCEPGLWLGQGVEILHDDRILFRHRHVSDGPSAGLKEHVPDLPGNALWAADLRDGAFSARESTGRRRSRLIWKSLRAAAAAALLLLVFQLFTFGLSGFNALRDRQLRVLEPKAVRVENKLTLAQRLTQSTEEDLKPFLLMEVINPLRPDTIYYDKVRSRAFNELQIEGQSNEGVTPVNAFADSIQQLPWVERIENNSRTRSNQTSFDFVIRFSSLPPGPAGGFTIPAESEPQPAAEQPTEGRG